MPKVNVRRRSAAFRRRPGLWAPPPPQALPRMVIREELSGFSVSIPYAPREMEISGQAAVYQSVTRAGRAPLLVLAGQQLEERSFDLELYNRRRPGEDIQDLIRDLRRVARSPDRLVVKYGSSSGLWRVRELTLRVLARSDRSDLITRARATLVIVKASDVVLGLGPVTGGAKAGTPPAPGKPVPAPRTHVVARGETLTHIAVRYYRDASAWRRIADHNKVRDPRRLRVGQRLVIP